VPEQNDWGLRAACRGEDPELFFPDPSDTAGISAAVAVCVRCPVTAECAAWATRSRVTYGVFAGRFHNYIAKGAIGRPPGPCGTSAALRAHRHNGEHCEVCLAADRQRREARKARR